ncbi:MAG TPA: aminotransferase class I/II-fold pyridoxal phosphate-dependent enzyme [Dehalococcoidia bacterium]|nr:aminotransferase class I/II-fold pyridoxal phosphate-dependent enzyme [Dehalococcoidia bacterium]
MVAARTSVFTESVIREMSRLAALHGAVNLAQGYPDFPAPRAIKDAAIAAIEADHNQYAITWGAKPLRDAIAKKALAFNGITAEPERDITVTCGATEAMMATMLALIEPGDEVIVFEPFYENYNPDAALAGAKLVFVPLRPPEYRFESAELRAAFGPRTKAIVVNTPHNPTGRVLSRAELETIAGLCREFNVLAITDEIYEHIIYDGRQHISLATLPEMAERTITISGFSKTFSVTGWRLGYVIARPPWSDAIRKCHDFLTVGAPAPLQEAGAVALGFPPSFYDELRASYTRRRAMLLEALQTAGFSCAAPEGAYYIMADIRPLTDLDDVQFTRFLIREIGVAPVPGSSFCKDEALGRSTIRFTFSKGEDTLAEAARRLPALSTGGRQAQLSAIVTEGEA